MTDIINDVAILIPAYRPDNNLIDVVGLLQNHFSNIIIVNDGSGAEFENTFSTVQADVKLIKHLVNKGKGAALKSGFEFIEKNLTVKGVITVDADGQHMLDDVLKLANHSVELPNHFILGVREFSGEVPLRSKFGNKLTLLILKTIYGLSLSDSQTGLRYIPTKLIPLFNKVSGDRYEFELYCLLELHNRGLPIVQVPINTVYLEQNDSSHFRPIRDSIRVYSVFLKFSFSSVICFCIDIALFSLFLVLIKDIMIATVTSRVISGCVNFLINRNYVFNAYHGSSISAQACQYLILWLVVMLASGFSVSLAHSGGIVDHVVPFKLLVDSLLFILSFYVQRYFIFKSIKK